MSGYTFQDFYIPERMMPSIEQYITDGIQPGTFLSAVICNDLKGAVMWADQENMGNLPAYASYFYTYAPIACWGSKGVMDKWIGDHKRRREK